VPQEDGVSEPEVVYWELDRDAIRELTKYLGL
jgi:hypothetical protein